MTRYRSRLTDLGPAALMVIGAAAAWFSLAQPPASDMGMAMAAPAYLATWVAMLSAMMLPATAPLAIAYGRVVRARGGGHLAALPFTAGYLALWTLAGMLPLGVYLLSRGSAAGMTATPAGPLVLGGALVLAGLYQLSPLKGACLRACRSPLGFVMSHDFATGAGGGLWAGAAHGVACLGCCWALMAVLTVAGLMNLAWMAALAALILVEKNWRHGPVLARAAGVALIALGVLVAL